MTAQRRTAVSEAFRGGYGFCHDGEAMSWQLRAGAVHQFRCPHVQTALPAHGVQFLLAFDSGDPGLRRRKLLRTRGTRDKPQHRPRRTLSRVRNAFNDASLATLSCRALARTWRGWEAAGVRASRWVCR